MPLKLAAVAAMAAAILITSPFERSISGVEGLSRDGEAPAGISSLLSVRKALASTPAADVGTSFKYYFSSEGTLKESLLMDDTTSPYWWLSSGGVLEITGGIGKTAHGKQPLGSELQLIYEQYSNEVSEGGLYPQNVFRIVTRSRWKNFTEQTYFRVGKIQMTDTSSRTAANGVFLFNRYQDENNVYYTGVRVDGLAVIKKKYNGSYYTMAQKPVWQSSSFPYNTQTNPNFIPGAKWIGLRSEVTSLSGGGVNIKLYVDSAGNGTWVKVAEGSDTGQYGNPVIATDGHGGIRTDFMDVSFDNYSITEK